MTRESKSLQEGKSGALQQNKNQKLKSKNMQPKDVRFLSDWRKTYDMKVWSKRGLLEEQSIEKKNIGKTILTYLTFS